MEVEVEGLADFEWLCDGGIEFDELDGVEDVEIGGLVEEGGSGG